MKLYLILLAILSVCSCGHIYVSDAQLYYQNTGYVSSAQLYFKLENSLEVNEVLKIVWPYAISTGDVTMSICTTTSTTATSSGTTLKDTSQGYLHRLSAKLNADQWYILNISSSAQSPTVQYYNTPIKMSTHSGMTTGGLVNEYLMYDYNNACGFIAIAPAPVTMSSLTVSDTEIGTTAPTNTITNKYFEATYSVYLTFLTAQDYEYGGTFYFTITSGFKWTGSCEAVSKNCGEDSSCVTVNSLTPNSDYTCSVSEKVIVFKRLQNSTKLSVNHQDYMRIKATVKNPSIVDSAGGVTAQFVSNYAYYLYEIYTKSSQFATESIKLSSSKATYFWGLSANNADTKGCPVRIFLSDGVAVWNKISFPFYPELTLPDSAAGFKLYVNVEATSVLNEISIYTDASAFGSDPVKCIVDDGTEKYIICKNIGKLASNQTKYIKFAFTAEGTDYGDNGAKFTDFGTMQIKRMDGETITTTAKPTEVTHKKVYDAKYAILTGDVDTGNRVLDIVSLNYAANGIIATTDFSNALDAGGNANGRSSIKYSKTEINLFFPITTTYKKTCCDTHDDGTNDNLDCGEAVTNDQCKATIAAGKADSLILKIIANSNALTLNNDDKDSSTTAGNIYNGVELYPSTAVATKVGFFGMDVLPAGTVSQANLCQFKNADSSYAAICSTYSINVTYNEAKTAALADEKKYLFNQWHLQSGYLELHTVCYAGYAEDTANICGGAQNAIGMGVVMRGVTLAITSNHLYPHQSDLDFIMCFRYQAVGSPSLDVDGSSSLASSSLINAQIINFKSQTDMTASTSIFRIGILNYFEDDLTDDHLASYVPTLLRVGGSLHTDEVTTNEGVAFFFNGANIKIGSESLSDTMPLNPAECGSPIHTGMACRWFNQKAVQTASTKMHLDYYPGLNAIIVGGVSITATEFNFYIPVQITVGSAVPFTHAFLALIQEHSTFPTVTSVYKLFGTAEMTGTAWVKVGIATSASFTDGTEWGVQTNVLAGPTAINSKEDYEKSSADNTYGTLQLPASAIVKADLQGWTGSNIYPGATVTEVTIDASIDSGDGLGFLNDDLDATTGMQGTGLTHSASAHYMIHSNIKYWSGAINWTLADSSKPFKSRCADMAITSFYATDNTPTAYIVICPYEGKFSASATAINTLSTLQVQFSTWTWPDYYGQDGLIGAHLRYLWTDKLGNLQAYLAEKKKSTEREDCTLGSASSIFAKDTLQKKAQLAISPINSISLDPKTDSPKDKEWMTINVLVGSATQATATTPQCSSGLSKIQCSVSKSSNTFAFTLTNTDEDNSQSIPNSQVTLIFWLSSTSTTDESSSTYTASIVGNFYYNMPSQTAAPLTINKCEESAVWTSSSQEDRTITVNNPNRDVLAIGARTPFSFTFSASYTILDISKFTIDLKFLATANTNLLTNLRCAVYTSTGSTLLHLFDKFDYSSLSAIEFNYKAQDSTLNIPVEIGTVSYKFLCHGGEVMATAPSSSSLINVKNSISSIIAEGSGTDQSGNYASLRTVSSSSVANVTMTKTFDVAGQDSVYTFNVKTYVLSTTSATNVTTTSIRFKAGSYFYVEFARDISPRFNQMGIIRCYHESYPTYCKYESERRIAFIARTDLNHNQTYGHNFSIIGVQRPAEFQNYKKMYFALVPYLSEFNELTYQSSDSTEDAATTDQIATTLPVVYFSQESGDAIRSTYTMKMHIKMPANTVIENVPIYVDFPGDFDETMFLGWSPSCQFRNVQIDDNDTISNYANSCSLENIRRVKINMSSDSNNTDIRLYELTISSIPTYHYEQKYSNAPIVWFGNSTANTVPIYKTNLGYFNGTFNLKTFTFSDAAKQLLTWDSNEVKCYIGTYRCKAKLKTINSEDFFYDIDSFTSSGTYSDYFSFNPSKLAVDTGKAYKEFEIAPKASTAPGYYQLKWNHEQTTYYSVLPPLFLIALNSQTELDVTVSSRTYEVPDGGRSLPIIFDFAGKMPETDLTIDGTSKSLEINGTNYITSKYVKFVSSQKTMKFVEEYTSSQIQFIVKGEKVTGTNEPDTPSAILSWTLSGTNQASYKAPNDVTITVVNAIVGTPELTLNNPESSTQGYNTIITAKCGHSGTFYYVVSQDQTATQIEYSTIKTATEDANILETEVGTVYTNPKRTLYGYYLGIAAETDYSVTITGKLQSEATHYLRMYCVNQMDTASEAKDISWKQASNGGKPLVSTMKFESTNNTNGTQYVSLSTTQKKEVACIICKEAKIEKDKVFGTDGVACSEEGAVVSTNTTNSTRRLLQTTTNATEYYVVMPDLFASSGSLDDAKTTLEGSAFRSALTASEALTGVKLNSISCSINSGYPSTPLINSPSVSPAENSITFTWTGANNTDGFVFAGVAQYTNATVDPTALQLKKNSGYSFDAFNKAFYYQDTSISVTVSPTTKCLDYKYYWVATNEDPDTYQYTTGVKSGTTKTIGCPTFAGIISQSMFLIAFLFILMILA